MSGWTARVPQKPGMYWLYTGPWAKPFVARLTSNGSWRGECIATTLEEEAAEADWMFYLPAIKEPAPPRSFRRSTVGKPRPPKAKKGRK